MSLRWGQYQQFVIMHKESGSFDPDTTAENHSEAILKFLKHNTKYLKSVLEEMRKDGYDFGKVEIRGIEE